MWTTRGRAVSGSLAGRRGGRGRAGPERQSPRRGCCARRAPTWSPPTASRSAPCPPRPARSAAWACVWSRADADPLRRRRLVVVSPGVPLDGAQLAPARRRGVAHHRRAGARLARERGGGGRHHRHQWQDHDHGADRRAAGARRGGRCWSRATSAPRWRRTPRASPPTGGSSLEVSSFQLETIETFRPRVAAVLNVTPDHLDRHGTLAAYAAAKARIFENQGPGDVRRPQRRRRRGARPGGVRRAGDLVLVQPPARAAARRLRARRLDRGAPRGPAGAHLPRSTRSRCAAPTTSRTSWPRRPARAGSAWRRA